MKIEHVALWCCDLDATKDFYVRHFAATAGSKYTNAAKGFSSYFLSFSSGARLELMTKTNLRDADATKLAAGYAHFALALGSEERVRAFTGQLRLAGVTILSEPRWTGDGYYESAVADPEGNLIELTI